MARKPRIEFPGAFFHVIARGNNRENIFRGERDYLRYLEKLLYFSGEAGVTVYAYCLMPNHVHLVLEMGDVLLSKMIQRFHTWYTLYFNKKYGRVGHVFQGRYKSILCDKDAYLLELVRYVHLNPVRAGLVKHPQEYRWSSHSVYLALDKADLIDSSLVLRQFSDDLSAARGLYASFIMQGVAQGPRGDLYNVRDQRVLGDRAFVEQVFESDRGSKSVGLEKILTHFELDELKKVVESVMGKGLYSLRSRGRCGTWIRRIFCYVARTHGDHRVGEVAHYLGKDLATVTLGVRFVEEALRSGNHEAREVVETVLEAIADMENRSERKKEKKTQI